MMPTESLETPTDLMTPPPVRRGYFNKPRAETARRGTPLLSHDWEPMLDVCSNCRRTAPNHHERVCAKCGASMLVDRLIWNRKPERVAMRCSECGGAAVRRMSDREALGISAAYRVIPCEVCRGIGWLGIDPTLPTDMRPGNEAKVIVIAARYVAGLPLWHANDWNERPNLRFPGPLEPTAEERDRQRETRTLASAATEDSEFDECEELSCSP